MKTKIFTLILFCFFTKIKAENCFYVLRNGTLVDSLIADQVLSFFKKIEYKNDPNTGHPILYDLYINCKNNRGWISSSSYLAEVCNAFGICEQFDKKKVYGKVYDHIREIILQIVTCDSKNYLYYSRDFLNFKKSKNKIFEFFIHWSKETEICVLNDGSEILTLALNKILLQINKLFFLNCNRTEADGNWAEIESYIYNMQNEDVFIKYYFDSSSKIILSYADYNKYLIDINIFYEVSVPELIQVIKNCIKIEDKKVSYINPVKETKVRVPSSNIGNFKANKRNDAGLVHKIDFKEKKKNV